MKGIIHTSNQTTFISSVTSANIATSQFSKLQHTEECNVNAKYTDRRTSKEQQKTVSSNKNFYSFYL